MIWQRNYTLDEINQFSKNSMLEFLEIHFTKITDQELHATMPIHPRVKQPYGYLHGGASVVLAESVASVGANLTVDMSRFSAFGMSINANHIKAKKEGVLTAIARPLHRGASTQIWSIHILDEKKDLVCVSRLTVAVRKKVES